MGRIVFILLILALVAGGARTIFDEARSSRMQSQYLAEFARDLYYWTEEGPNADVLYPRTGPYNQRLGYTHIPHATERLSQRGYEVTAQGRMSEAMIGLTQQGIFPIYHEKSRAGLTILDRDGEPLYDARFPQRKFDSFEELPELLVSTLLFIENRELLDPRFPNRNPAVEWKRFAFAAFALVGRLVGMDMSVFGGSTLATQIEKFRHSEEGRTGTSQDKIQQMLSASLRAYLDGENTWGAQQRIILDYVNGVPLAAVRGYGEVHGMADGLWAWFGEDPRGVMNDLRQRQGLWSTDPNPLYGEQLMAQARAYRMVLSLLIAHRRPSYYLVQAPDALQDMTDQYLRVLANSEMISTDLRDRALAVRVEVQRYVAPAAVESFVERKAIDSIRTHLLTQAGIPSLYDLDRFDLEVRTTIDPTSQQGVTDVLKRMDDPAFVADLGLKGHRLLDKNADLSPLVYSFTLYERTDLGNALRIQADSYDQPMNINEQVKLDLGSTAKLRTLVSYLEVIAELHGRLSMLDAEGLRAARVAARDNLTRWTADHLLNRPDSSLEDTLRAAMARPYSGSPQETFFTGGGAHTFSNFDNKRNHVQSVSEAFRHSVNLVFIRMMRDVARYYMYIDAERVERILTDADDPERIALLGRFADQEGRTFQNRFIDKYRGKDDVLAELVRGRRITARRLAVAYRAVAPDDDFETFSAFVAAHAVETNLTEKTLRDFYDRYGPQSFNLSDQGYLSRIHPLELWTANYLRQNPQATYGEIIEASRGERQEVYRWLLRTSRKHQQDRRLRIILEEDTFAQIHASWARLGYPFESLVPSYATSIGSSADRPAALAELVGILVNDGLRLPTLRVESYTFAEGTPYETRLGRTDAPTERVLPREVALVAREALLDVVNQGTARRIQKSFVTRDGTVLEIGGKTGTGDHRHKSFVNGRLVESRAINRTATFAFFIADRFFGTLTVFVPGEAADEFRFTSALTVQLLRSLAPALMPLLDPAEEPPATDPEAFDEPAVIEEFDSEEADGDAPPMPLLLAERADEPIELIPSSPGLPSWAAIFRNDLSGVEADALAAALPPPWYERAAEDIPRRILPNWRELMEVEGTPLPAWSEIGDEDVGVYVAVEPTPHRTIPRRNMVEQQRAQAVVEDLLVAELDEDTDADEVLEEARALAEAMLAILGIDSSEAGEADPGNSEMLDLVVAISSEGISSEGIDGVVMAVDHTSTISEPTGSTTELAPAVAATPPAPPGRGSDGATTSSGAGSPPYPGAIAVPRPPGPAPRPPAAIIGPREPVSAPSRPIEPRRSSQGYTYP